MSNLQRDVVRIGAQFNGRLAPDVLADALEYTEHNESGLALDGLDLTRHPSFSRPPHPHPWGTLMAVLRRHRP